MDRPIARPPAWRRYARYGAGAVLVITVAAWLLHGIGSSTYRVPADQLTIGTVTRGKFEYAHRIVNLLDGEIVTKKARMAV